MCHAHVYKHFHHHIRNILEVVTEPELAAVLSVQFNVGISAQNTDWTSSIHF